MSSLFSTVLEFSRGFAILASVLLAHVLFDRHPRSRLRASCLAASYALAGGLGMLTPIQLAPGFFFDLRGAVIGLAVLFAGPLPALFVSAALALLRIGLGGAGAPVGVGAIAVAYLVALLLRIAIGPKHRHALLLIAIAEGAASAMWLGSLLPREVAPLDFIISQAVAVAMGAILTGLALQLDEARRNAEADAIAARDTAERANQAKNVFLAHMSHELRTPLNAVIGFAEALQVESLARDVTRVSEYGSHIVRAGNHLLFIVSDLLDLARIETGRLELHECEFAACEMVDSVRAAVLPQADRAGVRLELGCAAVGDHLFGDPHRLAQVLINLASNAIDATHKGWVRLDCEVGPTGEFLFRVTDNGEGIPGEAIPGLLRPFNQRGSAMVRRKEGSVGIGLPLSRALVELHGGTLTIESRLGQGTTATVALPESRRRSRAVAA
jgi:signal transduction histidine kinase